jgi:hypothetical protein
MSDHATRITKAAQARKLIGQAVRWWPLHLGSYWAQSDTLHEVAGKNVRLGSDWQWLPDIWMVPEPQVGEAQP